MSRVRIPSPAPIPTSELRVAQADERPLRHPAGEADLALRIGRAEERHGQVVGGELMDDRRHGLDRAFGELRLAEWPDEALELRPGDLRQSVRTAAPRSLAVGDPEAGQEAVLDESCQAALGDPLMAVREEGRQLGRHDVALDEP